jgi:hypothetical protein
MVTKNTVLNKTIILFDIDKNIDNDINSTVKFIVDKKKLPFENIYAMIPIPIFQKFIDKLNNNGIKYKEISFKYNIFLVNI